MYEFEDSDEALLLESFDSIDTDGSGFIEGRDVFLVIEEVKRDLDRLPIKRLNIEGIKAEFIRRKIENRLVSFEELVTVSRQNMNKIQ